MWIYLAFCGRTGGSNEQSIDGISTSENLLDIGSQAAAMQNGFGGNWCAYPLPPANQVQNSKHRLKELYLKETFQRKKIM